MTNPLGDLISRGEGGYNSYNRGTSNGHILPASQRIDFSQMTLNELQRRQALSLDDPDRIFAVGKYQMIPATLKKSILDLGVNGDENFSPELQERMFSDVLIVRKRPQISDYIRGVAGATLYNAQKATCREWASVDDPDTPGKPYKRYEQQGNHASTRAVQVALALNEMRSHYQTAVQDGVSPEDAWRLVTGQTSSARELPLPTHPSPSSAHSDPAYFPPAKPPVDQTKDLQQQLNHLGYRDSHGHALTIDGTPGPDTAHAIKSFQHAHRLHVDGVAGKDTLAALVDARHSPLLSEATHPAHPLYRQVLHGIQKLPHGTFGSQDEQRNLAVALTIAAHVGGLKKVDHVVLGTNGVNVFAVQGRVNDPTHLRIHVDRVEAMTHVADPGRLALHQAAHTQPVHAHVHASPSVGHRAMGMEINR